MTIVDGANVTEYVGSVALAAAIGGSSALARSGVMGARLAMGARSAMLAADVVQAARGVVKYQESGDVTDLAGAAVLVGGHALGRLLGRSGRAVQDGCAGRTCFVAGTQVLARDEFGEAVPVAIETVKAGDMVWSRSDQTGEEGFKVVVETYVREKDELVHLSYRTGGSSEAHTLVGTEEHPFWSLTRDKWVPMGELQLGEELSLVGPASSTTTSPALSSSKGTAVVTELRIELAPLAAGGEYARSNTGTLGTPGNASGQFTVYNFQVEDYHTYFAAPEADKPFVWVHNADKYLGEPFGGYRVKNKFPDEPLPTDGRIDGVAAIADGRIQGIGTTIRSRDLVFVITTDMKLILGSRHHLLGNRGDVLAAGTLKLSGSGRVRRIDNLSGHYQPTVQESATVPELLRSMGLNLKGAHFQLYEFTANHSRVVVRMDRVVNEVLE